MLVAKRNNLKKTDLASSFSQHGKLAQPITIEIELLGRASSFVAPDHSKRIREEKAVRKGYQISRTQTQTE